LILTLITLIFDSNPTGGIISVIPLPHCREENREFPKLAYSLALHIPLRDNACKIMLLMYMYVYLYVRVCVFMCACIYSNSRFANIGTWNFYLSDKSRKNEKEAWDKGIKRERERERERRSSSVVWTFWAWIRSLIRTRTEHDSITSKGDSGGSIERVRRHAFRNKGTDLPLDASRIDLRLIWTLNTVDVAPYERSGASV